MMSVTHMCECDKDVSGLEISEELASDMLIQNLISVVDGLIFDEPQQDDVIDCPIFDDYQGDNIDDA